ncbi:MAG: sulfur carrier protein ThiS [Bacteroidales bacterium]|nr:sulfur carrier protein ThiS [Bacteroidales bacterium]HOL98603.1 sulfur carrier protein ThiS [Bacteroidales bacterium]HOM36929.1 sulfur carrier protein ThiS [Bacteroidales bacterium]HPD24401.1 sulfur carrier protein ThiS [Bacteroidales bacterium]HRT00299.1 sulfur carrier protein ThiS [Bacteroidales bacterium]
MQITLNNKIEVFPNETLTIKEILELKKFTYPKLIVKLNDVIIEKEDFESTFLKEGDNLIILHLLAGG